MFAFGRLPVPVGEGNLSLPEAQPEGDSCVPKAFGMLAGQWHGGTLGKICCA